MELTTEVAGAHRALSEHNLAFVETALADPQYRRRENFAALSDRQALLHYPLQAWPTFVGPAAIAEFERVAVSLHRLGLAVPQRVFGGDVQRIADFYGIEQAFAARTLDDPPGIARAPSRGDYILSSTGLKILEFNCGSSLGGWQVLLVADKYLDHPLVARFLSSRGITVHHRNTMELLFRHMLSEAVASGIAGEGEYNLAFTLTPSADHPRNRDEENEASLAKLQAAYQPPELYDAQLHAALKAFPQFTGGRVLRGSFSDFEVRDGGVWHEGVHLHSIYEVAGHPTRDVFRCYREGGVHIYSGPLSMILTDKRNLALLSKAGDRDEGPWTDDERRVMRDHIPWTRQLLPVRERFHGEEVALPDLLVAQRERLVLKQGLSFGGAAVHLGRSTEPAAWADLVAEALADGSWIVQELVDSQPFVYQDGEDACDLHDLVWGLFVFGDVYAGAFIRLQPREQKAIVNVHHGATVSLLLEVEEAAAEG